MGDLIDLQWMVEDFVALMGDGWRGLKKIWREGLMETGRKATPFEIAHRTLCEALRADGWEAIAPGDERGIGGRYQYYNEAGEATLDPEWILEYEVPHGISKTVCHDRIGVRPAELVHQGFGGAEFDPAIRLQRLGPPGHPHSRGDRRVVCYHARGGAQIHQLHPEGVGAMLAALVHDFPTTINPKSIANGQWAPCKACGGIDVRAAGTVCETCGGFWCVTCQPQRGRCPVCGVPLAPPEGVPPWAYAVQRFQWPPSTGQYRRALLVGCGVTGSWAALILNRTFAQVDAWDPDALAHPAIAAGGDYINRGGIWMHPGRRGAQKAMAIEFPDVLTNRLEGGLARREAAFVIEHRRAPDRQVHRFGERPTPVDLDVVVLCLDTAGARLQAEPGLAHRILDVRGTPESCVFWALPGRPDRPRHPAGGHGVVPEAHAHEPAQRGGYANGINVCVGCGVLIAPGDDVLAWGTELGVMHLHARCRTAYEAPQVAPRALDLPPLTPAEESLWAAWRASLERYLPGEAERCGDHHDAVSMAAGAVTAQFLTRWIDAGMPTGIWEVPLAIEGLDRQETIQREGAVA